MISRMCYCFRLSRVSYSLYCNKLSVHNSTHLAVSGLHVVKEYYDDYYYHYQFKCYNMGFNAIAVTIISHL